MKCERCQADTDAADCREFQGQTICEDCYMTVLSPPKACDPWAVYSAKSFSAQGGSGEQVTAVQAKILALLKATGGAEREVIAERLELSLARLDREIATLRHMEKLKAKMQGEKKIICLW